MGKKTEIVNLPTKMLAHELGSKKRWSRIFGLGALLAGALGGVVYFVVKTADARELASLEAAFTDLDGCLIGEPLTSRETAASRVGGVELAVLGTPKDKRGKAGEAPWPTSCAPAAYAVSEHAGAAENGAALKESADALAKALKEDANVTVDLAPLVDKVWTDAANARLQASGPAKGPTAPKAAVPVFTREAFAALPKFLSGNFTLSNIHEEPSPSGAKLRLLVDQREAAEGPALCTASGGDTTIHCTRVPGEAAKKSPGLRLVGTIEDRALPFYFAGDRGQLGIYPPNGKDAVTSTVALGAVARPDGSLFVLTHNDATKDIRLIVAPATGATTERPLLASTEFESTAGVGLFWDWLVYKNHPLTGAPHLLARHLGNDGPEPAAAQDLGAIDVPSPANDKETWLSGCRSDEALAVRVAGGPNDSIALFASGRWSAPVKTATRGGALTCHGVEAVATQVTHAVEGDRDFPIVAQSRCSSSGCNNTTVAVREMLSGVGEVAPIEANAFAAADVGGNLLVVWNAGATGGLRMRFAPAAQIRQAADIVIADDHDPTSTSKLGLVTELRVFPSASYAVLLIGTTSGVRSLLVDGTGNLRSAPTAL